jgi:hypothetical protein
VWKFPLVTSCQHSEGFNFRAFHILDFRIRVVQPLQGSGTFYRKRFPSALVALQDTALYPHAAAFEGLIYSISCATSSSHHGPRRERAERWTDADSPVGKFGSYRHVLPHRLPHLSLLQL